MYEPPFSELVLIGDKDDETTLKDMASRLDRIALATGYGFPEVVEIPDGDDFMSPGDIAEGRIAMILPPTENPYVY
jgi:hypothetical protein